MTLSAEKKKGNSSINMGKQKGKSCIKVGVRCFGADGKYQKGKCGSFTTYIAQVPTESELRDLIGELFRSTGDWVDRHSL